MLLSKPEIQRHLYRGDIIIDEFKPENLGSAQYDVSLGEYFYRENALRGFGLYNPYSEKQVHEKWILNRAKTCDELDVHYENINLEEKIIILEPGEIILGHTEEFIGGASNNITTMMKARSSLGRNCIEIARCAGMGDVGFCNRWTLEICNTSRVDRIILVVGRRVGQLLFFKVDPIESADMYDKQGKYQRSAFCDEIQASWKPQDMLPKMYKDRENPK